MVSVFGHWARTNCIICNTEMMVSQYYYDDMEEHVCTKCAGQQESRDAYDAELLYPKRSLCECGATAAGDIYHARWCPVYIDPMAPKRAKEFSDD